MRGDTQVTNLTYDGSSVTPVLEKKNGDVWTVVESDISYRVDGMEINSSSYIPFAAGNYGFSAVVEGEIVATAFLAVSKKVIIVTPEWQSNGSNGAVNNIPAYQDIKLVATDEQGLKLDGVLDGVMTVACDLYTENGETKTRAAAGVHTVAASYVDEYAEKSFRSCYSVTVNSKTIYFFSDAITVRLSAGENGAAYARYIAPGGTEFSFDSGSQILMDYGLEFVAEPNDGWTVDKWTITIPSLMGMEDKDLSNGASVAHNAPSLLPQRPPRATWWTSGWSTIWSTSGTAATSIARKR